MLAGSKATGLQSIVAVNDVAWYDPGTAFTDDNKVLATLQLCILPV